MRVMMLSQFYPPAIGGEEQHVAGLSAALAARGHEVSVVTLATHGLPAVEKDGPVRVYRINGTAQRLSALYSDPTRRFAPPMPDPELMLALRGLLERERPQVVHAHNWLLHSYLPFGAVRRDTRLVVTLHDYSLVCATKRLMYRGAPCAGPGAVRCLTCAGGHYGWAKGPLVVLGTRGMRRIEHAAVDMYLPVSEAVALGTGLVGGDRPYRVIPNFVPDDVTNRADETSPLLEQLPAEFVLFAGDLSTDKGVRVLLSAYTRLVGAPPLVLLGRRCLDTPARFHENVFAPGPWPREAVLAAWKRSLFAIVPSVWPDPCPTVAMEALACGRPVVATAMGGLKDIVDESCGMLVAPGDADALARAMRRLVDDPALRQRLSAAAVQRARAYMAGSVVPRIEQVYEHVTRRQAARAG